MLEDEGFTAIEEKSIDDTLRETLAAIRDRGEDIPEEKAEVAQPRDEAGKFAAKVEQVEQAAPAAPVEEVAQTAPEPTVPPELQRLGLRKEEAEAYMQAPKALQDAFMRRAEEMGRGIEQYKSKAQFADSIGQVIQPHMQTLQSLGVTPDVAIGELLKADQLLRYGSPEQKQQKFFQLARDYGISLEGVPEAPQIDPHVYAMQQELRQVRGALQQFQSLEQQREQSALNSQIESFRADPNHGHFEAVREHMASLLQAGLASDLKAAYEQAVWANPQTRAAVLAQQQEAARQEATQRAKAAKEAASVNVPRRPSLPAAEPIGTMEDTIRNTLRRLTSA